MLPVETPSNEGSFAETGNQVQTRKYSRRSSRLLFGSTPSFGAGKMMPDQGECPTLAVTHPLLKGWRQAGGADGMKLDFDPQACGHIFR